MGTDARLDNVLSRLRGVKQHGARYRALCPAHGDRTPSLNVWLSDDGWVCFNCFAGCTREAILQAAGLTLADLGPDRGQPTATKRTSKPASKPPRVYPRHDLAADAFARLNGGKVEALYRWSDTWFRARIRLPDGKTFAEITRNGEGWILKGPERPHTLFRQDELPADGDVVVTEGEKACMAAWSIGLPCTTSGSASSAASADWAPLAGRSVTILPDNDPAGAKYAQDVTAHLYTLDPPATVKVVALPGLGEGDDLFDFVEGRENKQTVGATLAEIQALIDVAPIVEKAETQADAECRPRKLRKVSDGTRLVRLAKQAELYHDGDTAYASWVVDDHLETWPVASRRFRTWLARAFYEAYRRSVSTTTLVNATVTIEGEALFAGAQRTVALRLAETDGAILLDLADEQWRIARVDTVGWKVIQAAVCPIRFRRSNGEQALPVPVSGGTLDELRDLLNVASDADFTLLIAWLVAALRPTGPYPILAVNGEQGSAKTSACRMLRGLVDPNAADLRAEPREERDLVIAAQNGRILALDNVSFLPSWLSDALCRIATGSGFATRTLFTDGDETIFSASRPVMLNGITNVVERADLLDRAVLVTLDAIPDHLRRDESDIRAAFAAACPSVLGCLLDRASAALRALPTVKLTHLPRMADFARWSVASHVGCGLDPAPFLDAYDLSRATAVEQAIEASIVGPAVLRFVTVYRSWRGTPTDLLGKLAGLLPDPERTPKKWPGNARALSGHLTRLAPNLRRLGVDLIHGRTGGDRWVSVERVGKTASLASLASQTDLAGPKTASGGDATGDANGAGVTQTQGGQNGLRHGENPPQTIKNADRDAKGANDARIPTPTPCDPTFDFHNEAAGRRIREATEWATT